MFVRHFTVGTECVITKVKAEVIQFAQVKVG
jgi:hypothetical protein